MIDSKIEIKVAKPSDARELLKIYTYYVENTAISFEWQVPIEEEFRNRIENTLKKYPYIVAKSEGEILGYAYTNAFKERGAYGWVAEPSIYVRSDIRHQGLGRRLYECIEEISKAQGVFRLNACIGYTENPDEYLNGNSVDFHHHMGYEIVGEFHNCGYKFGNWYGIVLMEKELQKPVAKPSPIIPFPEMELDDIKTIIGGR